MACVGVAATLVFTAPRVPRPALLTVLGDGTKHVVLEGVSPTAHRVTAGVDQSGGSVRSHWVLLLVERLHLGDIIHTGALTMLLLLHLHVLGLQKLGKLGCHLGHTWVKLKITNMRGENQRKFLSLALSLFRETVWQNFRNINKFDFLFTSCAILHIFLAVSIFSIIIKAVSIAVIRF